MLPPAHLGAFLVCVFVSGCTGLISDDGGDPGTPVPIDPSLPSPADPVLPARLVRLTPSQLERTAQTLVPDAEIAAILERTGTGGDFGQTGQFSTVQGRPFLTESHVRDLNQAFRELAEQVVAMGDGFAPCIAETPGERACVLPFVVAVGTRALRREPTDEEQTRVMSIWESAAVEGTPVQALVIAVRALLMSPHFLFRSEVGAPSSGGSTLTAPELASALAYQLTDGPPDALLAAADLSDPTILEEQARRLLADPEGTRGVVGFFSELFDVERVRSAGKDPVAHPEFDNDMADAMVTETQTFLTRWLVDDAQIATLFTANHSYVNGPLAELYGVDPPSQPFGRVDLDPAERAGILTQGAFLAGFAHPDETSIVFRGQFILRTLMCGTTPPPPEDVDVVVPSRDRASITLRDHIESAHSVERCASCHALMDPLGFAFESFDAIGRYRTDDTGLPLNTRGVLRSPVSLEFADAPDLSRQLAESSTIRSCIAQRFVQYLLGTDLGAEHPLVQSSGAVLEREGGDVRELVVHVVTSDTYRLRRTP